LAERLLDKQKIRPTVKDAIITVPISNKLLQFEVHLAIFLFDLMGSSGLKLIKMCSLSLELRMDVGELQKEYLRKFHQLLLRIKMRKEFLECQQHLGCSMASSVYGLNSHNQSSD
jgi:hypothetical protein